MMKPLVVRMTLASFLIGAAAYSQEVPPSSDQADAVQALVTRAVALIEKDVMTAAFTEFRKKGSEWLHGDTYLYVYDLKGNVLLNATFPKREGTNIAGGKDAKGKPFQDDILKVAAAQGSRLGQLHVSQARTD